MSIDSVEAAQACREHLGISSDLYKTVEGYIEGKKHTVSISIDSNKIEFYFDVKVGNYQAYNTDWQAMEWDDVNKTLTISSSKPSYSFTVFFPEP
ncbi:hypothetical protein [Pantoea sp. Ep11b]|uniref:hypothetical protein n=1 Tax=Pantoea sp. Ep11b TaxID=3141459 RepID=UPI0034603BD0